MNLTDKISVAELDSEIINKLQIFHYDIIDSTNLEARRLIENDTENADFLVVSDIQSQGRGRLGRSFFSQDDNGIYMTYALNKATIGQFDIVKVTTLMAVVVNDAIKALGKKSQIKWVNDIYIDNRKVSGILCESFKEYVLVGIGINLYEFNVPIELVDKIGFVCPDKPCKNGLISDICNRITEYLTFSEREIIDKARENSMLIGRDIVFWENNLPFNAKVYDIDDNGGLVVTMPDGKRKILRSGEISINFR